MKIGATGWRGEFGEKRRLSLGFHQVILALWRCNGSSRAGAGTSASFAFLLLGIANGQRHLSNATRQIGENVRDFPFISRD